MLRSMAKVFTLSTTQYCFCVLYGFSFMVGVSVLGTIMFLTRLDLGYPVSPQLSEGIQRRGQLPETLFANPVSHLEIPCHWTPDNLLARYRLTNHLNTGQCRRPASPPTNLSSKSTDKANTTTQQATESHAPNVTSCLRDVISNNCDVSSTRVPPVAHYVRFGRYNLSLDCFLSVISVVRFLKPCLVVFHGDAEPEGPYWEALLRMVPEMVYVYMKRPRQIFGHVIKVVEHSADVARLKILIDHGGVYLDTDHLLVNPLHDLLNESLVLGVESPGVSVGNGFLISQPNATFLQLWLKGYTSFQDNVWAYHSTRLPHKLSKQFPRLVRVVNSFFKPGWAKARLFFAAKRSLLKMDWHRQHGVHIYTRMVRKWFPGETRVDKQDNTMGDIVRYILFGDERACT